MPDEHTKVCAKCGGDPQPIGNFHSDSHKPDGRRNDCKSCVLVRVADYRKNNRATLRDNARIDRKREPVRGIWHVMNARCANASADSYARYGGRGIKVCDRWRGSYEAFRDDMGHRPDGMSIDRIDVNAGYDCGKCEDCLARGVTVTNCRWATAREQGRNKRENRRIEAFGESLCAPEWAERYGVPRRLITARIDKCGWSAEDAVSTPPRPSGSRR